MNYRASRIGNHFLVAWHGTPQVDDVAALTAEIEKARDSAGQKLDYWLLIPGDHVTMPAADARTAMQASMSAVRAATARFDVVLSGDEVRLSLLRSGLRAMAVVTRTVDHVTVHSGLDAAIQKRAAPREVEDALRALAR